MSPTADLHVTCRHRRWPPSRLPRGSLAARRGAAEENLEPGAFPAIHAGSGVRASGPVARDAGGDVTRMALRVGAGVLPIVVRLVVIVCREVEHSCHIDTFRNRAILRPFVRVTGVAPDSSWIPAWVPALIVISYVSVCVLMWL